MQKGSTHKYKQQLMAPSDDSRTTILPLTRQAPTCRLLSLPAEIRNHIYGLAFAMPNTSVDIFEARRPDAALLQTCRKIHSEATVIYIEARRQFWSTGNFTIDVRSANSDEKPKAFRFPTNLLLKIFALRVNDLKHVTRFSVRGDNAVFIFDNGIYSLPKERQFWLGALSLLVLCALSTPPQGRELSHAPPFLGLGDFHYLTNGAGLVSRISQKIVTRRKQ